MEGGEGTVLLAVGNQPPDVEVKWEPPTPAHPQLLAVMTSFSTEVESRMCLDF